jgi:hypothetical protein
MPGPAPKDPSVVQRRNRASTATTLSGRNGRQPRIPINHAHRMTREWWTNVWASPMAGQYTDADRDGLAQLCMLVEDFWTAEDSRGRLAAAAEIRMQGVRFGLSPIDRRRLQWTLPEDPAARPARGGSRRPAGKRADLRPVPDGPDPRDVLTA